MKKYSKKKIEKFNKSIKKFNLLKAFKKNYSF